MTDLVKSVSYNQTEIIKSLLQLYVPSGKIDCDPTYSIGAFYNGTGVDGQRGLTSLPFFIFWGLTI